MDTPRTRLFTPRLTATFVSRPNRFVMLCRLAPGEEAVRASVANPGRMEEFLVPGIPLALEAGPVGGSCPWRVLAVQYRGAWIPLQAHKANQVVRDLWLPRAWPDWEARPEAPLGEHRMDFRLDRTGPGVPSYIYVEVKSCTLVEEDRALFPDAPSPRATSHVETLAALPLPGPDGLRHQVVWVIQQGQARRVAPNPHTDVAFARAVRAARGRLDFRGLQASTDDKGWASLAPVPVEVDWEGLEACVGDAGYLLAWELAGSRLSLELFQAREGIDALERRLRQGRKIPARDPHRGLALLRTDHDLDDALRGNLDGLGSLRDEAPGRTRWEGGADALGDFRRLILMAQHRWAFDGA